MSFYKSLYIEKVLARILYMVNMLARSLYVGKVSIYWKYIGIHWESPCILKLDGKVCIHYMLYCIRKPINIGNKLPRIIYIGNMLPRVLYIGNTLAYIGLYWKYLMLEIHWYRSFTLKVCWNIG